MKRKLSLLLIAIFGLFILVACGNGGDAPADNANGNGEEVATPVEGGNLIAVVSREEGSGARDAFEDLVNFNQEEDGSDAMTTENLVIGQGNGGVATTVVQNEAAIGYVAFATVAERGDDLRPISINGVEPTVANVLAGDYELMRPFNFVYRPENRETGSFYDAFITFAQSRQGRQILRDMGAVVDVEDGADFDVNAFPGLEGQVTIGGSTSTESTAMALADEFMAIFPNVEIRYEATGSSAGIRGAGDGTFNLGFASRAVSDDEAAENGLNVVTYCYDGIVVVVHPSNPITNITLAQLRDIFLGNITSWDDIQ